MTNEELAKFVRDDDEKSENERNGKKLGRHNTCVEDGMAEGKEDCHEHDDHSDQLSGEYPQIAGLVQEGRMSEERVEVGASGKDVAKALHDDQTDEGHGLTSEHEVLQFRLRVALVSVFPVVEGEQDVGEVEVRVEVNVQEEETVGEEGLQATKECVGLKDERGVHEVILLGAWWSLEQVTLRFLEHHRQGRKHVGQNANDDHLES